MKIKLVVGEGMLSDGRVEVLEWTRYAGYDFFLP